MYDTINVSQKLRCPHCSKILKESSYQTKDIDEFMCCYNFEFPDVVDPNPEKTTFKKIKLDAKLPKATKKRLQQRLRRMESPRPDIDLRLIGHCQHCGKYITGTGKIRDYILCQIEIPAATPKAKSQILGQDTPGQLLTSTLRRLRELEKTQRTSAKILTSIIFLLYNDSQIDLKSLRKLEKQLKLDVRNSLGFLFGIRREDWPTTFNIDTFQFFQVREFLEALAPLKQKKLPKTNR